MSSLFGSGGSEWLRGFAVFRVTRHTDDTDESAVYLPQQNPPVDRVGRWRSAGKQVEADGDDSRQIDWWMMFCLHYSNASSTQLYITQPPTGVTCT